MSDFSHIYDGPLSGGTQISTGTLLALDTHSVLQPGTNLENIFDELSLQMPRHEAAELTNKLLTMTDESMLLSFRKAFPIVPDELSNAYTKARERLRSEPSKLDLSTALAKYNVRLERPLNVLEAVEVSMFLSEVSTSFKKLFAQSDFPLVDACIACHGSHDRVYTMLQWWQLTKATKADFNKLVRLLEQHPNSSYEDARKSQLNLLFGRSDPTFDKMLKEQVAEYAKHQHMQGLSTGSKVYSDFPNKRFFLKLHNNMLKWESHSIPVSRIHHIKSHEVKPNRAPPHEHMIRLNTRVYHCVQLYDRAGAKLLEFYEDAPVWLDGLCTLIGQNEHVDALCKVRSVVQSMDLDTVESGEEECYELEELEQVSRGFYYA